MGTSSAESHNFDDRCDGCLQRVLFLEASLLPWPSAALLAHDPTGKGGLPEPGALVGTAHAPPESAASAGHGGMMEGGGSPAFPAFLRVWLSMTCNHHCGGNTEPLQGPSGFCCSQRKSRARTSGYCGPQVRASGLCPTAVFGAKLGALTPAHAANGYMLVTSSGPS